MSFLDFFLLPEDKIFSSAFLFFLVVDHIVEGLLISFDIYLEAAQDLLRFFISAFDLAIVDHDRHLSLLLEEVSDAWVSYFTLVSLIILLESSLHVELIVVSTFDLVLRHISHSFGEETLRSIENYNV